jgi:hypothetical protein
MAKEAYKSNPKETYNSHSLLTLYYLLFTTYSLLQPKRDLQLTFTTYSLLLALYYLLFTTCSLLLTLYFFLFTTYSLLQPKRDLQLTFTRPPGAT